MDSLSVTLLITLRCETADEVAPDGQSMESGEDGVEDGGSKEEPCIREEKSTAGEFDRLSV